MDTERFYPKFDKLFWITLIPTLLLLAVTTVISAVTVPALIIAISIDIFTLYFFISPFSGYVELRDSSVFIKFGFILKKEIPYKTIREITRERKFYADSIVAMKSSLEHVNIKYNRFDVASVSVTKNDEFVKALKHRIQSHES